MNAGQLKEKFLTRFGGEPRVFRAPGRVNLIGEHTDYNDGFVLPAAIGFATNVAVSGREDRTIRAASLNFEGEYEIDLDQPNADILPGWARYVQGVATILEREGFRLGGADILINSDIPIGAGLSSSAALEVAVGFALTRIGGAEIDGLKLAQVGQRAEHEFAGVRSGIMDQFASVFGRDGHALFLDCRSMEWSAVPVTSRFLICNTRTKHQLADGEYNRRRAECERAAAFFDKTSLRDVSIEDFERNRSQMPVIEQKRAKHILYENRRVLDSVEALRVGDIASFARQINASHESLRDDFQISCRELDVMVEAARRQPGVLAARMTGGGFGGCAIALLEDDVLPDLPDVIAAEYKAETGIEPEFYECRIGGGVRELQDRRRDIIKS
jgi:galactokinase